MENEKAENLSEEEKIANPDLENTVAEATANAAAEDELQKLKDELAESKDKYLRLYAKFDNYHHPTPKTKKNIRAASGEKHGGCRRRFQCRLSRSHHASSRGGGAQRKSSRGGGEGLLIER